MQMKGEEANEFIKEHRGGWDHFNLPENLVNESLNDMEELSSTNECYRQQGIEVTNKNPKSPIVSQRSTPTRTKPRSSGLETRKTTTRNSNDGGDKDPTKKNIEKSHVVHTSYKIKRETRKTGLEIPEIQESP
jgi:hypothetical protein